MGCGIKAWREEEEEQEYLKELNFYRTKKPEEIMSLIHSLKSEMRALEREDVALTRWQFSAIDRINKLIGDFIK